MLSYDAKSTRFPIAQKRLFAESLFPSAKSLVTQTGMHRQTLPPRMFTMHFNYSLFD